MAKRKIPEGERTVLKAGILKGLAHPVRVAIAEMLEDGELCACDIADRFDCDRTTTSKHLAVMRELDILQDRREGQNIYYSLKMKCLVSVLKCIDGVLDKGKGCEKPRMTIE